MINKESLFFFRGNARLGPKAIAVVLLVSMFANCPALWAQDESDGAAAVSQKYPDPVLTPTGIKANRKLPSFTPLAKGFSLSARPSDQEIFMHSLFEEPLVPVGTKTSPAINAALGQALVAYSNRNVRDDYSALENYLAANPQSPWRMALLTDLGWVYRQTGWYGKSLDAWEQAWLLGKKEASPQAKAIADRALSELVVLNARLGRTDRLAQLFKETDKRTVSGSAREKINSALEGYQLMLAHPDQGYRCGPMALATLRNNWDKPVPFNFLDKNEPSSAKGTSLTQIYQLAHKMTLDLIMAKRTPGSEVMVPSVVNWKVGHFAAIVGKERGLFHLKDPTFNDDVWISPRALDAEASGYFLIKNQHLPAGWTPVSAAEGKTVWGKGPANSRDPGPLNCPSPKTGCSTCHGMATVSIYEMLASLSVQDTPLFYQPSLGPSVSFTITYLQRESAQPATFTYSNLGSLWTFNWLAYLTDDPANPGATVTEYQPGGGEESYTGYNSSTQTYAPQSTLGTVLKLTGSSSYELDSPDGSKQIFAAANTATPRKIFLTQTVDAAGNSLTYSYDSNYRMVGLTDAAGLVTTISYGSTNTSDPGFYRIATVTDPFSRTARFAYNSLGQLQSSTDMIGIVSSFKYNASATMTSLQTPYGTTTFSAGQDTNKRWVQITDPQGGQERVESWVNANSSVTIPPSSAVPSAGEDNIYVQYRNTFYWNKKAMLTDGATLNYNDAEIIHWLHQAPGYTVMSDCVESRKKPLENRVYYHYINQPSSIQTGDNYFPIAIKRVLDDGTTPETDNQYNSLGMLTQTKDPSLRVTNYTYDSNGIDLLKVSQVSLVGSDTLYTASYNSQHEPLSTTDASGQPTTYTYFANGQVHTVTNAKSETTTYAYNSNNQLTSVTGAVAGATTSMTYDGFNRLQTQTDINGYTTTFNYDSLNRPTQTSYPDGTYDQNVYTNLDRTLSRDRQGRWTRYLYNPVRQMVGVIDPQDRATSYERCICGELNAIVDAKGQRTKWTNDLQGRVTRKTYADGTHLDYAYENTTSRLHSMTDVLGSVATYTYKKDDNLASVSYAPASGVSATPSVSFNYDSYYNRMTSMTDGTGSTNYTYKSAYTTGSSITGGNRLLTETGSLGSTAAITYTYDQLGRVTGTSINGFNSTVAYDSLGRISGASDDALGSFTYAYYGVTPRLQTLGYPNGQSTAYSYYGATGDFRLSDITNYRTGTTILSKFDYTYNPVGTIATWQQQADSGTPTTWSYGYDKADQLVSAVQATSGTTTAQDYYSYDPAGNRTTEQQGLASTQAGFNSLNQLTSVSAASTLKFTGSLNKPGTVTVGGTAAQVDANNNFTGTASVTTGTNTVAVVATNLNGYAATNNYQVVVPSSGTTSPTYDGNGNMTNNGAGQAYVWDAKNELNAIIYSAGANAGNHTEMTYDGMSRRIKIVEATGTTVGSGTITSTKQYVWKGNSMVEERDASNAVTRRFFSQGEQIAGANYYYSRDHLGSVRELCDGSGTLTTRYNYDPYGRITASHLVTSPNTTDAMFQFTGDYCHQVSGLSLTLYRAYDPNAGRWLSRDPLKEVEMRQGPNIYIYVRENPINALDLSGLQAVPIVPSGPINNQPITPIPGSGSEDSQAGGVAGGAQIASRLISAGTWDRQLSQGERGCGPPSGDPKCHCCVVVIDYADYGDGAVLYANGRGHVVNQSCNDAQSGDHVSGAAPGFSSLTKYLPW